ncbi:hypothetical protein BDW69DRAFT_187714 [Aspergillus filifer]
MAARKAQQQEMVQLGSCLITCVSHVCIKWLIMLRAPVYRPFRTISFTLLESQIGVPVPEGLTFS